MGGGFRSTRRTLAAAVALCGWLALASPARADSGLFAGASKVDITPPTGYYRDGYATNDRTVGTWTRLYAQVLVLESGGRKVALVTMDLVGATGGAVQEAVARVKDLGFSESNVLVSGTHTHSGVAQYSNFGELNAAFPGAQELVTNPLSFGDFSPGGPPDSQVYTFLVNRLALAIRMADHNLGPAAAGWSDQELLGVTQNRSLEAHLANFGLQVPNHQGSPSQDPGGYKDTIDPALAVLRIDKLAVMRGRVIHVPIGAWTDFANHGTDVEHDFALYGGDHQAIADRLFQANVQRAGRVPRGQAVVNVFANGDEGDMSSGLVHNGPAWAVNIGRREAQAMLHGWRVAGRHMTRQLSLDTRWTRVCFCGQTVNGGGAIDTKAVVGLPVLTGSEEGRGPLFDATHTSFEGRHLPTSIGPQGDKIPVVVDSGHQDDPNVVPLEVIRIGDHLLAAVPGEPTVELGRQIRAAIAGATAGAGLRTVTIVGLANEYVPYFTTPAEYDYQDYEGGHTVYGRWSGYFIRDQLADLAGRLASGQPAPAAVAFDPTNGIKADGPPYGTGAARGSVVAQPAAAQRLTRVVFSWRGGRDGLDRPLDRAFVTVQRLAKHRRWTAVTDDLGFQIMWTVDSGGVYRAAWQVPLDAALGRYRFRITANRYRLLSRGFKVARARTLTVRQVPASRGRVAVQLAYPPVVFTSELDTDLTDWPAQANGGSVAFRIGHRRVIVRRRIGLAFTLRVPLGASVTVTTAHDRFGNVAPRRVALSR